jgi:HAD superfamily hydrolase (TIGR01509 family)
MRAAAVLVDAGRVLVHPADALFRQAARQAGCDLTPGVACRALGRTVWQGAAASDPVEFWRGPAKILAWSRHAHLSAENGRAVWRRVHEFDLTGTPLWSRTDPGAAKALRRLATAGLPVAVVSNNDGRLRQQLAAADLLNLVATVVDSAIIGTSKPAPGIFAYAAAELGVQLEDCIMIGDDPYFDIRASLNAGVGQALLIDPGGHRPGDWPTEAFPDLAGAVNHVVGAQ